MNCFTCNTEYAGPVHVCPDEVPPPPDVDTELDRLRAEVERLTSRERQFERAMRTTRRARDQLAERYADAQAWCPVEAEDEFARDMVYDWARTDTRGTTPFRELGPSVIADLVRVVSKALWTVRDTYSDTAMHERARIAMATQIMNASLFGHLVERLPKCDWSPWRDGKTGEDCTATATTHDGFGYSRRCDAHKDVQSTKEYEWADVLRSARAAVSP